MRSAGHEVRAFSSALDFVHCRNLESPLCLILDVSMPDLNGLELQEYLTDRGISLPIVFITGHGTVPMNVKAMKAGAMGFLQKPFSDTDRLNAISNAIETDRQKDRQGSSGSRHGQNGRTIPCGPRSICVQTEHRFPPGLTLNLGPRSNTFPAQPVL
jgi:FixJ family two-component response regulator